jgi:adenylate cyclase
MGIDEEGTLAQLKAHRKALVDPKIAEHRGRIVKTTGDGMLVEFASVVDALRCAVEVQRGMAERNAEVPEDKRIEFRVGIHQGDVIIEGGDIFGDGVNVAARLEGLAEPGGISVSGRVQEDAEGKVDIAFENAGEQQLKNIARPVRVYRVRLSGATSSSRPALPLPDKPSIAVLPFQNMSGDLAQEYFADGVVEEIITALSRFRQLFVIARNSSFTYKGRAVDVKQVGRELGVRYVLEGSVRKSGSRVRITGQLIDAATGTHLWADRFDGALEDIFDLQDDVAARVVGAIAPKLEQAEIARVKHKPTESLDAYDYYLRGIARAHEWTLEGTDEALRLLNRAVKLDPRFASAYGIGAWYYARRKSNGWIADRAREVAEGRRFAERAAELGREDALALSGAGFWRAYVATEFEAGAGLINRALELNENFAGAWYVSGWVNIYLGEPDAAITCLERAMRLSPFDAVLGPMQGATAFAHFFAGRYEQALSWAEKAMREQPKWVPSFGIAAAVSGLEGRLEQARNYVAATQRLDPTMRVSTMMDRLPLRRPKDLARLQESLRKAGLPE